LILIYGKHIRLAISLFVIGGIVAVASSAGDFISEFILRGQDEKGFTSMSGRTYFWSAVLDAVSHAPVLGQGFYAGQRVLFGSSTVDSTYLEVLLNLGVVGFLVFLSPLVLTIKNIYKSRPVGKISKTDQFLWLQIAVFFTIIFIRSLSGPTFQVLHHNLIFYGLILIVSHRFLKIRKRGEPEESNNKKSIKDNDDDGILRRKGSNKIIR